MITHAMTVIKELWLAFLHTMHYMTLMDFEPKWNRLVIILKDWMQLNRKHLWAFLLNDKQ